MARNLMSLSRPSLSPSLSLSLFTLKDLRSVRRLGGRLVGGDGRSRPHKVVLLPRSCRSSRLGWVVPA